MKRTRNLFLLRGTKEAVSLVAQGVQYKALVSYCTKPITLSDVMEVFNNNKNILCTNVPSEFRSDVIEIQILPDDRIPSHSDCIYINQGNFANQFQLIADKYNCDIGDHVSNSSGLSGIPSIEDCPYCQYLRYDSNVIHSDQLMIYKSKHFFVIPTLGQFIHGYLLIIPFEHVMSISELSSSTRQEFLTVLEDVQTLLSLTYYPNRILIWENGTGNTGRGKAKDSIVHAHVHVAPSTLTAKIVKEISGFPFEETSIEELSSYGEHSYLLIKGNIEQSWKIISNPSLYIPRQYIRQMLAQEYLIPGEVWNWRKYPFDEVMRKTAFEIFCSLKSNWKNLPNRLKKNIQVLMSHFDA